VVEQGAGTYDTEFVFRRAVGGPAAAGTRNAL
jgi:hypothetical protein